MTVKRPATALATLLAAAAVARARPAAAHPEGPTAGTSRYVTAKVAGGRVEVTDLWLVGALAAVDERRRFDADGDGAISDGELARARAANAAEPPALGLTLDGALLIAATPAGAVEVTIDLGGDARVGGGPLVIETRTVLALPAAAATAAAADRPHELRVALTRDPPRPLDTEIAFDLDEPGYTLADPAAPDRVRFRGPRRSALEDRSATFAFTSPAPPRAAPRRLAVAALAVLAAAALAAAIRRRLRRQR